MRTVGRYHLVRRLAVGGVAEVWLARATATGPRVALKIVSRELSEDPGFLTALVSETQLAMRLDHPNLVQLHDLGEADGRYYLAMQYVHGESLLRAQRKAASLKQTIPWPIAVRVFADLAHGLAALHSGGVVYRSLEPRQLQVGFDGSARLMDFVTAHAADRISRVGPGLLRGKLMYLAPEQAMGLPVDARTDVFTLGLILYEALTSVRPFQRDSELASLKAVIECGVARPAVSPAVDAVVMRALAKEPEDRYRDGAEFHAALEGLLADRGPVDVAAFMKQLFPDEHLLIDRLTAGLGRNEPIAGFRHEDGTVTLDNEKTGQRWFLTRDDTLVVHHAPADGVLVVDVVGEEIGTQRVGVFHCSQGFSGLDPEQVRCFLDALAAASGCRVQHEP